MYQKLGHNFQYRKQKIKRKLYDRIIILQHDKHCYLFHLRQIDQKCDESEVQASDYTLLISNIPDEFTYEGDIADLDYSQILKEFLHKNLGQINQTKKQKNVNQNDPNKQIQSDKQNQNQLDQIKVDIENQQEEDHEYMEIVSVGLCYDLNKYYGIDNNLTSIMKKLQNCKKENEKSKLIEQKSKLKKQRDDFSKEYINLGGNKYKLNNFAKYAYVILQYEEDYNTKDIIGIFINARMLSQIYQKDYLNQFQFISVALFIEQNGYLYNRMAVFIKEFHFYNLQTALKLYTKVYLFFHIKIDQQKIQDFYKEIEFITSLITSNKTQKLIFQNHEITVQPAPDPNNIFWENLSHSQGELAVRRSALFFTTLLVLGGCLGLLFSFQLIQMKVGGQENKDSPIVSIMSYTISVSIILINAGVQKSIFMIASKEARSTKAGYFDSVVVKHAVAHFLNTSVLLFVIQVFIYTDGDGYGKLFKAGGLAYNMNSIFMTNMIVQNIVQFINIPYYLAKSIKLSFKKLENNEKLKKHMSQETLNKYFENPIFDLQRQYSVIIASIFSALFYAPIIPFCLIWTMIQLFLKYWVDKYTIIKKSTLNVGANINLCLDVLENLEYALPIYSLSNLIFFVYISKTNEVDQISILGVFIGIIHAILPMQFFNERFYKLEDNVSNQERYEDIFSEFLTDYDKENPIKKDQALLKQYKALEAKTRKNNQVY